MIIGITGTDGAGETVQWTVARPCQLVCELVSETSDKVYSFCKKKAHTFAHSQYEVLNSVL